MNVEPKKGWRAVVAVAVCAGMLGPTTSAAAPPPWSRSVKPSFQTIERASDGWWSKAAVVVARNPKQWHAAMDQLMASGSFFVLPAPDCPNLDWSKKAVVLITSGRGAYSSIEVKNVGRHGADLILDLSALPGDGVAMWMPYHLVAVDRGMVPRLSRVIVQYSGDAGGLLPMGEYQEVLAAGEATGQPDVVPATVGKVKALYR